MTLIRTPLIAFSSDVDEVNWVAVNDDVMGGLSRSSPSIANGHLQFAGNVSLENNGGFASVRTRNLRYDLSAAKNLVLRVQGDGRTYQLRLATDARFRGSAVSYAAEFATTAGVWTEVSIPLDSLMPQYRGNRLNGPALDQSNIREIGLLIGDGRSGAFELLVDWIVVES